MTAPRWRKHGVLWRPDGTHAWAHSHATCPTPHWRRDGTLRLYVQCRDASGVGRIGWLDVDPADPRRVIGHARSPVLDVGEPGCFDDNGVFPTCVTPLADGRLALYYVGFELAHHVRYRLLGGVAVSDDDGDSFRRIAATPILERSDAERHIRGGPFVLREDGRFRMWYVAGSRWEDVDGKSMPVYDVRHAESPDGLRWPAQGQVVLPLDLEREHGIGRPFVLRRGGAYRMHYSIRRRAPLRYELGLAHSSDGLSWRRADDDVGLHGTPGQWDGSSIAYAAEVTTGGRDWIFYNGNDFGGTGVGLAERLEAGA
jgi:predicted GH43/DUF377 family glycosyl hydrolase